MGRLNLSSQPGEELAIGAEAFGGEDLEEEGIGRGLNRNIGVSV